MFNTFVGDKGHYSNELRVIVSAELKGQRKLWHLTRNKNKHILLQSKAKIFTKKNEVIKILQANILKSHCAT